MNSFRAISEYDDKEIPLFHQQLTCLRGAGQVLCERFNFVEIVVIFEASSERRSLFVKGAVLGSAARSAKPVSPPSLHNLLPSPSHDVKKKKKRVSSECVRVTQHSNCIPSVCIHRRDRLKYPSHSSKSSMSLSSSPSSFKSSPSFACWRRNQP
jgi:hypothetical protein